MSKIVIISNRLPLTVKKCNEKLEYQESIGGLVTGLKKYHEQAESIWAGWAGIACEEINREERKTIRKSFGTGISISGLSDKRRSKSLLQRILQ